MVSELEKIGVIHLYSLGYRKSDLVGFKLRLNNPSKIAELQELESWRTKFDVASAATEGFFSKRWVAEHLFNISEEEFLRNQRELFYDRKFAAALDAAAEGEDLMGGEAGGLAGFGEEDLAGEIAGEEPLEGEEELGAEEEEEETLLAAPGKRDDGYLTPGAKGKVYHPVKDDTRDMGARKRHMMRQATPEYGTLRKTLPGMSGLKSLGKGISESLETNYENEEKKLFEVNNEIRDLITELENKKDETKT